MCNDDVAGCVRHVRWEVHSRVALYARDAAGGQDVVKLHHAQRLSSQLLRAQRLTAKTQAGGTRQLCTQLTALTFMLSYQHE